MLRWEGIDRKRFMLYMWPSMYCLLFVCLSVCFLGCLFRIVFLRLKVVCLKLVCLRLKCFMIFRRPTYCWLSKCMVKAIFRGRGRDTRPDKRRLGNFWARKILMTVWEKIWKLCKSCRAGTEQTGPRLSAKLCETLEIIAVYKTEQWTTFNKDDWMYPYHIKSIGYNNPRD